MRLTIVKDDNAVLVDGERYTVDCSGLPEGFHALQWDSTHGEVEYSATRCTHCGARSKKGNDILSDVSAYQPYVDAWQHAKVAAHNAAVEAAERAKADAAGPQT